MKVSNSCILVFLYSNVKYLFVFRLFFYLFRRISNSVIQQKFLFIAKQNRSFYLQQLYLNSARIHVCFVSKQGSFLEITYFVLTRVPFRKIRLKMYHSFYRHAKALIVWSCVEPHNLLTLAFQKVHVAMYRLAPMGNVAKLRFWEKFLKCTSVAASLLLAFQDNISFERRRVKKKTKIRYIDIAGTVRPKIKLCQYENRHYFYHKFFTYWFLFFALG